MIMKKQILFFSLLFLFTNHFYGQEDMGLRDLVTQGNSVEALTSGGGYYVKTTPKPELEAKEKDAYYNTEWLEGEIMTIDGTVIKDKLRLRVYDNIFEMYNGGKVLDIQTGKIKEVYYDGKVFKTKAINEGGRMAFTYLEVLFEGEKYSLYKRYTTSWAEPKYNAIMDAGREHKQLKKSQMFYYLDLKNLVIEKLAGNKKRIVKQISACEESAKTLKKAKISVKKEDGLIKFFKLIDKKC